MSTAHVQRMMVYDTIQPPKLVLRSASRAAYSSTANGNGRPTYFHRYYTDPEVLAQNVSYSGFEHQNPYSNIKGRLVVRTHCESDAEYDYRSRCNSISRHQTHESVLDSVSSSSASSLSEEGVDVLEVSPSRPGFVRSPATMISPGHVAHSTEQHGYLPVAQVPPQHSPYNTVRSSVRYLAVPDAGVHEAAWPSSHTEDRREGQELLEEGDLNPNYWSEGKRYNGAGYEDFLSPYPHNPAARKANTTPTGTIRVNGAIITATIPKRCAPVPSPAEQPATQSAFFGFNPTPRSQRGPSSTGTGTVLRRGLHRHQHRRHSEGAADDFHQHGPTQNECTQCNGEGCVRSLAIKEYLRQMENGDGRGPEVWGPGVRQLVEENPGWTE